MKKDPDPIVHIAIVDDHPIVLKGIEEILLRNFSPVKVTLALTGADLLGLIQDNHFDLVILDISLPDMDGMEILKRMKKERLKIPVLIISMYPEDEFGMRALRSGARGYVTKRAVVNELVTAVREILSGGTYISPNFARKMLLDFENDAKKSPHECLSDREFQVMCMLGKGKTIREVSETIHLSANTVRAYRLRVLNKIGLRRTDEIIQYAATHGLAD